MSIALRRFGEKVPLQASALNPATTSKSSSSIELCRRRLSDRRRSSETLSMFFFRALHGFQAGWRSHWPAIPRTPYRGK